jgi:MYXO-CTERM domain-containing protein
MSRLLGGVSISIALLLSFGRPVPAAAAQAAVFPFSVTFATPPVPVDTWYAPWSLNMTPQNSIIWTVETAGGAADNSGNTGYWRAVRNAEGSSVQVLRYPVPAATDLYLGVWIRCPNYNPAPGSQFWIEAGALAGIPALPVTVGGVTVNTIGQHFDEPNTGGAWTTFKKFTETPSSGPTHDNGNVWTWYYTAVPINTGTTTVMNIGFKVGSLYDTTTYAAPAPGLDVGYDGLTVSNTPLTTPPTTINPPPVGGSGGGGTGGGGGSGGGIVGGPRGGPVHESQNLAHRCGCSTTGDASGGWALALLLASAALACMRRR